MIPLCSLFTCRPFALVVRQCFLCSVKALQSGFSRTIEEYACEFREVLIDDQESLSSVFQSISILLQQLDIENNAILKLCKRTFGTLEAIH